MFSRTVPALAVKFPWKKIVDCPCQRSALLNPTVPPKARSMASQSLRLNANEPMLICAQAAGRAAVARMERAECRSARCTCCYSR